MNFIINVKEKSESDEARMATVTEEFFNEKGVVNEDEQQSTIKPDN
ncbi:MAG: hypothetical protein ACI4RP_00045 [Acutalibacteraceae bacterium]